MFVLLFSTKQRFHSSLEARRLSPLPLVDPRDAFVSLFIFFEGKPGELLAQWFSASSDELTE